jgi:hypothetical protein
MDEQEQFSARASLAALGVRFQKLELWPVVEQHVKLKQKVLRHTPTDKLLDCLINILAGGVGVVEVNTRVRPDLVVQHAFGRQDCADQSTISDTLNACRAEQVDQLRQALTVIFRKHSRTCQHDYDQQWQLLEADMTGMPAGRQGEGVTKGYFAKVRNRRGRQLGRVLATWYEELVVERLYDGKRQLDRSLQELVLATEAVLEMPENKHVRTIWRIDGGGGRDEDIDWLLNRRYQLLVKVNNWRRAQKLAASVTQWYPDPKVSDRHVGWIEQPHPYAHPTRQLALRKRKADGSWSYHALVFTLEDATLFQLCQRALPTQPQPAESLLAALHAYDGRSGGVETQNRGDKQGLGLARRNKQRFAAQEVLVLLAQLAHNLVIWTRDDLAHVDQRLRRYGVQRTVRDVLQIAGRVAFDAGGHIRTITLNQRHPLARAFHNAYAGDDLSLILGQI